MRYPPFSIRSCTRCAKKETPRGSSPPPRTPEAPVHGGALLGLRGLESLLGDLLLQGETLVLRVRLLIADVEAIAAVRVGIAVDQVPVLRLRLHLERGERAELLFSLRRVGRLRAEAGGHEEVSRVPRLLPAHRGAAAHRERRRKHQ